MNKGRFIEPLKIQDQVLELYTNGKDSGRHIGFTCLRDHYNVKLGCTTYWTGSPTSGKTELLFESLLNLSEFYGWKHLIHTPETGSPADIVAELAHKYNRKSFRAGYNNRMTEGELYSAIQWINEHFTILENATVEGMNLKDFLKEVEFYVDNFKVQTVTIDPWDEIEHDTSGMREDEYLKKWLSYIRRFARKNNVHFNIVAHPRTPKQDDKGEYLRATAYDISGGSKWYNKGEAIIALHRPSELSTGEPNKNMVEVNIQKAKPKEIGTKGTVEMFFDLASNRYYEKDSLGTARFARKELPKFKNPETGQMQSTKPIQPNDDFDDIGF